ncbi:hypothetical protein V1514DRAFT_198823 [Lipomyces japonicus]|uniref:uncharacterized protein n=1 Tax=Lipomyces japonicus TaxID=56871 RepID=UPI0034CF5FA0
MSAFIGKYIARRFFKESVNNAFGTEDPYFEQAPQENADDQRKSKKRRYRPPPAGISENDRKVLTKVKRRAWYLDMSLGWCCCVGIGWSSVIGIIPGIGDIISAYLSYLVVRAANKIDGGLPGWLYSKMMANVIIDFLFGLVPIVGDVVDILYKANSRNALLLEKYLRDRNISLTKVRNTN